MKKVVFLINFAILFLLISKCAPISEIQQGRKYRDVEDPRLREEVERILGHLSNTNPALTEELQKLPELKKGLDEKRAVALNRIVTYCTQSQNLEEVKKIFDRMLSIGKKDRRKFSAPLQALFWLAEESPLPLNMNFLETYSKEKYRGFNKHLGEDEEIITFVYNIWKRTYDNDKWKDPNEVMDRLNSPHLFDLFFRDNIAYDFDKHEAAKNDRRYNENWGSYLQSAKLTIKKRMGICQDAANLAVEILTKTGYDVKPLQVKFWRPAPSGSNRHWVGLLKEGGLFFKIADDHFVKEGIVGPFKSIKEIADKVAEHSVTLTADYSLSQIPIP